MNHALLWTIFNIYIKLPESESALSIFWRSGEQEDINLVLDVVFACMHNNGVLLFCLLELHDCVLYSRSWYLLHPAQRIGI